MSSIKYFFQFLIVSIFFLLFKILGLRISSNISKNIVSFIGPFFRSKELIKENIKRSFPGLNEIAIKKIYSRFIRNNGLFLERFNF